MYKKNVESITENNDNHPQTEEITGLKLWLRFVLQRYLLMQAS